MPFLTCADPRLSFICPQPVDRSGAEARLERFPREATAPVRTQIGPLANMRSSSGCAVLLRTDSPLVTLHLAQLKHHQVVPQGVACEVRHPEGSFTNFASPDLRELAREVTVTFATGLERSQGVREITLWLPTISTCAVSGVSVAEGSAVQPAEAPEPRWLAIGDSLTQGFSVQSPTQTWVHRLVRRWDLPAWNLGVGGIKIEPEAFAWALGLKRWDLVTIALGSNHSWHPAEAAVAADRAAEMAELALAGGHRRIAWLLPPWKPCEEGKGPQDFHGVPLTRETGERVRQVRDALRERLAQYAPSLEVVDGLGIRDYRYYPDGLHPFAAGFAYYADQVDEALGVQRASSP